MGCICGKQWRKKRRSTSLGLGAGRRSITSEIASLAHTTSDLLNTQDEAAVREVRGNREALTALQA